MNMEDLDKIRIELFGHSIKEVAFAILCPIPSLYNKICKKIARIQQYDEGFYKNAYFDFGNNKKGLIVLVPQGIASQDAVLTVPTQTILLIGYSAALNNSISVGTTIEVNKAIDVNGQIYNTTTTKKFPAYTCGYSPCLIGNQAAHYQAIAKHNNCDIIDMETVSCVKAAQESSREIIVWLVVTDSPTKNEFWKTKQEDKEKINIAIVDLIDKTFKMGEVL